MNFHSSSTPLLTFEQVKLWVQERADIADRVLALQEDLARADKRLDAVAVLLPPEMAAALLGERPAPSAAAPAYFQTATRKTRASDGSIPVPQVCIELLSGERGGRTLKWLREKLLAMPDQQGKMTRSPTLINSTLKRLISQGAVVQRGSFYYHSDVLKRIEAGELVEEQVENPPEPPLTNELMRVFVDMGGRGAAGEVVAAARKDAAISRRLDPQGNQVYRWLVKQFAQKVILKDGDVYYLEGCAPSDGPSTLPFEATKGGASVIASG